MTNIPPETDECPPLTPDDKEILSELLYHIFQDAADQNRNLTRGVLREKLARYFFPWVHVKELLDELEEKDYVDLLTTRGGGVYTGGPNFHLWQEEMKPIDYENGGADRAALKPLILEPGQISALAALIKALAAADPSGKIGAKVRQRSAEALDEADFLRGLAN